MAIIMALDQHASQMPEIASDTAISVAIVKRARDWQQLITHHHYHMPIRHLTRISQSPWVAFYLPGWHHAHPHSVTHIAHVHAIDIMMRQSYLPNEDKHPHAQALYLILTFHALYQLPTPIISQRWRRISVMHTTWAAFCRADDVSTLCTITRRLQNRISHVTPQYEESVLII